MGLMRHPNGTSLLRAPDGLAGSEDCCCPGYVPINCGWFDVFNETGGPAAPSSQITAASLFVSGVTDNGCGSFAGMIDCTSINAEWVLNLNSDPALACNGDSNSFTFRCHGAGGSTADWAISLVYNTPTVEDGSRRWLAGLRLFAPPNIARHYLSDPFVFSNGLWVRHGTFAMTQINSPSATCNWPATTTLIVTPFIP